MLEQTQLSKVYLGGLIFCADHLKSKSVYGTQFIMRHLIVEARSRVTMYFFLAKREESLL